MATDPIQHLAHQLRVMSDLASGQVTSNTPTESVQGPDFHAILKNAILEVNNTQNTAQAKAQDFAMGNSSLSLEEVMVELQKANLSFQTMIAVRNRLVEAYKDVTNLQV